MFELISIGCAYERLHFVSLRCECGNAVSVDTDNFEIIKDKYVVLKEGVTVTCEKCGEFTTQ